jgi:hypothetical protein
MRTLVVSAVLLSLLVACDKSVPESTYKPTESKPTDPPGQVAQVAMSGGQMVVTIPSASPAAAPAAPSGGKEVGWTAPATWSVVPNASTMRKATLKIPRTGGDTDDGELSVIAASGGVEQNVQRWAGQFGGAKPTSEERTPNGLKVTVVSMKGTFSGGMPGMGNAGGPKANYMLLGAIVDLGEEQWFFKATGPEKTMTAAKKDFDAFVGSLKAK